MAALVRWFRLGAQSLWIDEMFTLNSAMIGEPLHVSRLVENVHGPLYSLLLHFWSRWGGDAEWALRLPSMLFGVALVPALAWVARLWIGSEAVSPAAWLAALSPFLVWYSQEARNYMLLMLWACVAAIVLLQLRERSAPLAPAGGPGARASRAGAAAYFGTAWAGLLTNFSFALLFPLHLRWWLSSPRGGTPAPALHRRIAGIALGGLVMLVLLGPWVVQAVRLMDFQRLRIDPAQETGVPLRGETTFHAAAIPFALHAFAVGYTLGPPLRELRTADPAIVIGRYAGEIAAVTLVFGALGLLGLRALRRRGRLGDAVLWLAVPAAIVSYFALRNFKVFNPRYLAVSMPAFLLVLAAGYADLQRAARLAFAVAIAALWGLSLWNHFSVPRYGKEDYRGAAALVRARGIPGEKLLALGATDPVFYYYRGPLPAEVLWLGYAATPGRLEAKLAGALAGARGAWLLLSRPEELDPAGAFAHFMGARFPEAEPFRLEGVQVWHLDRKAVTRLEAAAPH